MLQLKIKLNVIILFQEVDVNGEILDVILNKYHVMNLEELLLNVLLSLEKQLEVNALVNHLLEQLVEQENVLINQ